MNAAALSALALRELPRLMRAARRLRLLNARAVAPSVSVVGLAKIAQLNGRYRRKRKATDVLSFPPPAAVRAATGFLGEIVICGPVLRRQAREQAHSAAQELRVLLAHGLLHLLGYDHERGPAAARAMAKLEAKLLGKVSGRARGKRPAGGLISRASQG